MDEKELFRRLLAEFRKRAGRKTYVGRRRDISYRRGLAWQSPVMDNRWCFIALGEDFSLGKIVLVRKENLIST